MIEEYIRKFEEIKICWINSHRPYDTGRLHTRKTD